MLKGNILLIVAFFIVVNFFGIIHAEGLKPIKLPEPNINGGMLLMKSLKNRQSSRSFSSRELPMEMISDILWAAFGINRPESGKRTAPSAMNMQEIDIYVAMKSGLYLYDSRENILSPVLERDIREFTGKQDFTQEAPLDLIYVADFSRMKGDEASKIFYSAVDVGFISQNVYLFCASKGLATVILGWVDKPALEKIMNLKDSQKVILTQPVAYPKE